VLVLFLILSIALFAFTAYTIDLAMVFANKNAHDHVSGLMATAAVNEFHFGPRTQNIIDNYEDDLTPAQIIEVFYGLSMVAAQTIFLEQQNAYSFLNTDLDGGDLIDPFEADWIDWNEVALPAWLATIPVAGNVDWPAGFVDTNWANYGVRFGCFAINAASDCDTDGDYFKELNPFDPAIAADPTLLEGAEATLESDTTGSGGVKKAFSQLYFGGDKFAMYGNGRARVASLVQTHAIVFVVDRSRSMAAMTVDDGGTGIDCMDEDTCLSPLDREHIQTTGSGFEIQPMTDVLEALQTVPLLLSRANRFRDASEYHMLGIVLFDVAAEALDFDSPSELYLEQTRDYGGVLAVLTDPANYPVAPIDAVPRMYNAECDGIPPSNLCDPIPLATEALKRASFLPVGTAKFEWGGVPPASAAKEDLWTRQPLSGADENTGLGSFTPWGGTNGGIGLSVAIELLRKARVDWIGAGKSDADFSTQIIFISDGAMTWFSDPNIKFDGSTNDDFPQGQMSYSPPPFYPPPSVYAVKCERGNAGGLTKGGFTSPADRYALPIAWRKIHHEPKLFSDGNDIYHDGSAPYGWYYNSKGAPSLGTPPASTGIKKFTNGLYSQLLAAYDDATGCPNAADPSPCHAIYVDDGNMTDTENPGNGISLSCGDLALMDWARFADTQNITIHAIGFGGGDSGTYWDLSSPPGAGQEPGYVMNFLTDPLGDPLDYVTPGPGEVPDLDDNKGFYLPRIKCNPSGCPKLRKAFRRIFDKFEVREAPNQ